MLTTLYTTSKGSNRAYCLRRLALCDPDPKDDRIPIGPGDVISMLRRRGFAAFPPWRLDRLLAEAQLLKDSFHQARRRVTHRAHSDIAGEHQQLFNSLISCVHAGSVCQARHRVHSYFPTLIFINSLHCGQARSFCHA